MTDLKPVLVALNRGLVSTLGTARADVPRVSTSAEVYTNFFPRVLGPTTFRPGLEYKGYCKDDGALIPFIYASDDTAILELTPSVMRVWLSGTDLLTRPSVSASVSNGFFAADLAGWTDADDAGCVSQWASGSYMSLIGTGSLSARRRQTINVAAGQAFVTHALRIKVARGPVILRIGNAAGLDNIFRQAVLRAGVHSINFNPTDNPSFVVEFSSSEEYETLVEYCYMEPAGVVELPTPWPNVVQCKAVKYERSNDVVYCADGFVRPQRIERRPNNSWSVCEYAPEDGPFLNQHLGNTTVSSSSIAGNVTLTASQPIFGPGHEGSLFRITSNGQIVDKDLASNSDYTDTIRVSGVGTDRQFWVHIVGTWAGTLYLERSLDDGVTWAPQNSFTSNTNIDVTDPLDNVVVLYRLGFSASSYTSGLAAVAINYPRGGITGVVRITGYTNPTTVSGIVIKALGGTGPTTLWAEGAWSTVRGWPSAVALWQGRLWMFKRGEVYGSVSDAYSSFDDSVEGDAGPVIKPFGVGSSHDPLWAFGVDRLLVGTDEAEYEVRSTAFREVVSPSNYNLGVQSSEGSLPINAVKMKNRVVFVERSGQALFELEYDATRDNITTNELTVLVPELLSSQPIRMAAQRRPEERLFVARFDGTAGVLIRDKAEGVTAWVELETEGVIEDVVVLPKKGSREDDVFFRVRRTIGGTDYRHMEKLAYLHECEGNALNKMADCSITGSGPVSGLGHLEGKVVVIWGDGEDRGTGVVSSGSVAGHSYTTWCAGLYYEGSYKSNRIGTVIKEGMMLNEEGRISDIGFILRNTHNRGLTFGPTFETMDDMPLVEDEYGTIPEVYELYTGDYTEFPGDWTNDPRVCVKCASPRPCTIVSMSVKVQKN